MAHPALERDDRCAGTGERGRVRVSGGCGRDARSRNIPLSRPRGEPLVQASGLDVRATGGMREHGVVLMRVPGGEAVFSEGKDDTLGQGHRTF